jgi:hypothetical protein
MCIWNANLTQKNKFDILTRPFFFFFTWAYCPYFSTLNYGG